MRSSNRQGLMAAIAVLAATAGMSALSEAMPPSRSVDYGRKRIRSYAPQTDSALAREIAEHNAEVERRKAEKRAAKMARRGA